VDVEKTVDNEMPNIERVQSLFSANSINDDAIVYQTDHATDDVDEIERDFPSLKFIIMWMGPFYYGSIRSLEKFCDCLSCKKIEDLSQ
jgi:hypothetical protein